MKKAGDLLVVLTWYEASSVLYVYRVTQNLLNYEISQVAESLLNYEFEDFTIDASLHSIFLAGRHTSCLFNLHS